MPREFLTDVDLKAGLLLAGSAGTSGQVIKSQGPGQPPVWGTDQTGAGGGASISSTDDLPEGTTNLYYTTARARGAISVTGPLSYNSNTGVIGLGIDPLIAGMLF